MDTSLSEDAGPMCRAMARGSAASSGARKPVWSATLASGGNSNVTTDAVPCDHQVRTPDRNIIMSGGPRPPPTNDAGKASIAIARPPIHIELRTTKLDCTPRRSSRNVSSRF